MSPLPGWEAAEVWLLELLKVLGLSLMWRRAISKQRYFVHKSTLHPVGDVCSDEWVLKSRNQEALAYLTENINTENFAQNIGYRSLAFDVYNNCCVICFMLVMAYSRNAVSSDVSCASSGRWICRYKWCFVSYCNHGNMFLYTIFYFGSEWEDLVFMNANWFL